MKIEEIKQNAFAMPITSPSYPKIDFKFFNREFFIIKYETDIELLRKIVPEPLTVTEPYVKFEIIRMPDSYGFGDYTESGQVIPVEYNGVKGSYVHSMYLNDAAPIVSGREIWGFPKKYAHPELSVDVDTLVGKLKYNNIYVAIATMGYKFQELETQQIKTQLESEPNFLLKIIPNCNGKDVDICQLVQYKLEDVTVKGAWSGPCALQLFHNALAPVAALPVKRVVSATHIISDLTLGFGKVVFDYLA